MKIKNWEKIGENHWENVYIRGGIEVGLIRDQPYGSLYRAYFQEASERAMISRRWTTQVNAIADAIHFMRKHQTSLKEND